MTDVLTGFITYLKPPTGAAAVDAISAIFIVGGGCADTEKLAKYDKIVRKKRIDRCGIMPVTKAMASLIEIDA